MPTIPSNLPPALPNNSKPDGKRVVPNQRLVNEIAIIDGGYITPISFELPPSIIYPEKLTLWSDLTP